MTAIPLTVLPMPGFPPTVKPISIPDSWRFSGRKGLKSDTKTTLVGFVKYLPSAYMDCTIPRFTVSCNRCTVSCGLLWFGYISSDSVKCKGSSCVQNIELCRPKLPETKKPCVAFNTQHRAILYSDCIKIYPTLLVAFAVTIHSR